METLYDSNAPKKPANLSVNVELLANAREEHINLSATLERALVEAIREKRRQRWLAENRPAIAAYNERVAKRGVFSGGSRRF